MSSTKIQYYREIVAAYIATYGALPVTEKPILINITGEFRNNTYNKNNNHDVVHAAVFAACVSLLLLKSIPSILLMMGICFICVQSSRFYTDFSKIFDGEIIEIDRRMIGVVMPTQIVEGRLEAANFMETNDGRKQAEALICADLDANAHICTVSVGSTTAQFINGQKTDKNEVEVGVDSHTDEAITRLLDAQGLQYDDILVVINSAGYALRVDAGIVYNDNQMEEDTITHNIVPRVVGGSGDNTNAMNFVKKVVALHKAGKYKYVLAFAPRGDPKMPQGGSHTNQRILEAARLGFNIAVIEVSGKQTKVSELMDGDVKDYSAESICGRIKCKKVLTGEGKTYGSGVIFRGVKLY
jgi:hypothetical protein